MHENHCSMSKFRKIFLKVVRIIMLTLLALIGILWITGNSYILRGIQLTYLKGHSTANIDDYKDFDNNIILAGKPQPWPQHELYNKIPLSDTLQTELTLQIDRFFCCQRRSGLVGILLGWVFG